jgi:hypothetical protein
MSPEILGKQHIFRKHVFSEGRRQLLDIQTKHDVVHDLEAFFWVFVWFCMSRDGPAQRRGELFPVDQRRNRLRETFADLFEAAESTMTKSKEAIWLAEERFEDDILANFSDYCGPLQSLAEEFYNILRSAHKNHHYEGLYDKVVDAFNKAEGVLVQLPSDQTEKYRELEEKEEDRRRGDIEGRWDIHSPSAQLPTAQSESPEAPSLTPRYPPEPISPTPAPKRRKGPSGEPSSKS